MSLTLLIAATGAATVSYLAVRDHRAATAARRGLLDDCSGVLDRSKLTHLESGFPQLSGSHRGRGVHVDLVLDTMTIRRLPQLWLSTTLLDRNPGLPGFSVLVRHIGNEFYALTSRFEYRLDPPLGFPFEVLVRGDAGAALLLARLAAPIAEILKDPRVKEVAITERGLRIVRQACEGKRGDHLLLRQSVFENAHVPREDLALILDQIHGMRSIVGAYREARAA
jgi:hypothetical protein